MSPGKQIYVHQQTAHNVTRYTDICTSPNCSQCHQARTNEFRMIVGLKQIAHMCLSYSVCAWPINGYIFSFFFSPFF